MFFSQKTEDPKASLLLCGPKVKLRSHQKTSEAFIQKPEESPALPQEREVL